MKIRRLVLLTTIVLVAACSEGQSGKPDEETPACREYRMMMTAPIPPDVHNRLQLACEQSASQRKSP